MSKRSSGVLRRSVFSQIEVGEKTFLNCGLKDLNFDEYQDSAVDTIIT